MNTTKEIYILLISFVCLMTQVRNIAANVNIFNRTCVKIHLILTASKTLIQQDGLPFCFRKLSARNMTDIFW